MKKAIILASLVILLTSCGKNVENPISESESSFTETTTATTETPTSSIATTQETQPSTTPEIIPAYIGNIRNQYDDANKKHIIFWQFLDNNEKAISPDAQIAVTIRNDEGEEVYNNTFEVTEKNYGKWSNKLSGNEQLLGSVEINDSEITEGMSNKGTISITATVSKGSFDPQTVSISNLPQKAIEVTLPNTPVTSNYYNFSGELSTSMTVTEINYEYDWSLKINITAQMTYNYNGEDSRDYGKVGYKITNGEGLIIKSGHVLFDKMSVGESQKEYIYVSDVTPGDKIIVEIIDAD